MTQKSPRKHVLLHTIENHGNRCQLTKNSIMNFTSMNNHVGNDAEQIQLNRDIGTNTPNYVEQIAGAFDNGNAVEEIVQAEASESYWKLITERRQQAIAETNIENQQLHTDIDDLSQENDKLRIVAKHCDYLQNILQTLTAENESLLDETK